MENNEIRTNEVIDVVTERVNDAVIPITETAAGKAARRLIPASIGMAICLTLAAEAALRFAVKPCVRKVAEWKKRREEKELDSYIQTEEDEQEKQEEDEEE